MTVGQRLERSGRRYTPPPVPIVYRVAIGTCGNCGKTRECAQVGNPFDHVEVCHECCLAIAERLSGVKWLNNWKGIQNAKRLKASLAKQRRSTPTE